MLSAKCLRRLSDLRLLTVRSSSIVLLKSNKVVTFTTNSIKPINLWAQNNTRIIHRTCTSGSGDQSDSFKFEEVCEETLESLCDYFEELVETSSHLKGADVLYGDGVLTVSFGEPYGTYVINRQSPNKQIWLSSPISGPKRYDFIAKNSGSWIYKHDGVTLHKLLQTEINKIVNNKADFSKCLYGSL